MGILGVVSTAVLVAVAGYAAVRWFIKVDTKIENRRRAAAELAATLKSFGLVHIPALLIDYSVGDYSGMGERMVNAVKLFLAGEAAVLEEFSKVFERCLEAKLKDPEGRAYISAMLKQAMGQASDEAK